MARPLRGIEDGGCYHVLNRSNHRKRLFHKPEDFAAFCRVLGQGLERYPLQLLAWCLMPNHWHLVLRPEQAESLPALMRWVGVTHVRRHHAHHGTRGGGHLYQGRYKCFPIQEDGHFLNVCRYVEANPLRAKLVERAEMWRWSSLGGGDPAAPLPLSPWPVERPRRWKALVNEPTERPALDALRTSVNRGRPYGDGDWVIRTARRLDLGSTLRPVGRPRKVAPAETEERN